MQTPTDYVEDDYLDNLESLMYTGFLVLNRPFSLRGLASELALQGLTAEHMLLRGEESLQITFGPVKLLMTTIDHEVHDQFVDELSFTKRALQEAKFTNTRHFEDLDLLYVRYDMTPVSQVALFALTQLLIRLWTQDGVLGMLFSYKPPVNVATLRRCAKRTEPLLDHIWEHLKPILQAVEPVSVNDGDDEAGSETPESKAPATGWMMPGGNNVLS